MVEIVSPWGYRFSVPFAEEQVNESGPNWVIYQRTDPTQIAVVWTGTLTKTLVRRNENLADLHAFIENYAAKEPPPPEEPPPAPPGPPMPPKFTFDVFRAWDYFTGPERVWQYFAAADEFGVYVHMQAEKSNMFVPSNYWARVLLLSEGKRFTFKPEEPPPPPPPPPPAKPPWRMLFEFTMKKLTPIAIFEQLFNATIDSIENLIDAGLDAIGVSRTMTFNGLEFDKAPLIMLVALAAIPDGTDAAVAKGFADDVMKATAAEIRAQGLKNPKGLAALIKKMPKEQIAVLFERLQKTSAGRAALETIQRVVLDQRTKITKWKIMAGLVGAAAATFGLAHTLNFIGFLGEESIQTRGIGVFALVTNKLWKEAAEALPGYKDTVDIVSAGIDGLMDIPVLNFFLAQWWPVYKKASYDQIKDYDTTIKEGLKGEEVGSIAVETTPTGATIWVNDVQHTYPSNSIIDKLIPGKYTVRLELTRHIEYEEEVAVEAEVQSKLVHEFEPIPEKPVPGAGRIEWEAKDRKTGATIGVSWYINGRLEKSYSTGLALDLDPAVYEMRWAAVGYEDYLDTVAIEKDKTLVLKIEMDKIEIPPEPEPEVTCEVLGYRSTPGEPAEAWEPTTVRGLACWKLKVPEKGKLEVNANIPASISLGGVDTGEKTPHSFDLTQGIYTVTLKAEGYITKTTTTLIKAGEPTTVFLELIEEEAPPIKVLLAKVSIISEPSGAKMLVNNVFTNKWTPDYVILEAGDYEISLVKSGYKTWRTPLRLTEE